MLSCSIKNSIGYRVDNGYANQYTPHCPYFCFVSLVRRISAIVLSCTINDSMGYTVDNGYANQCIIVYTSQSVLMFSFNQSKHVAFTHTRNTFLFYQSRLKTHCTDPKQISSLVHLNLRHKFLFTNQEDSTHVACNYWYPRPILLINQEDSTHFTCISSYPKQNFVNKSARLNKPVCI